MNATMLTLLSPDGMGKSLADRARETLAKRAGVSAASLKRFETTGRASLGLVLKLAHALSRLDEFGKPFQPPAAQSIEELERRSTRPVRKRGSI